MQIYPSGLKKPISDHPLERGSLFYSFTAFFRRPLKFLQSRKETFSSDNNLRPQIDDVMAAAMEAVWHPGRPLQPDFHLLPFDHNDDVYWTADPSLRHLLNGAQIGRYS